MQVLYKLRTGSFLFGTNTPVSDVDYKVVYLPELSLLLLGRGLNNTATSTKEGKGRNTAADTDVEYVPLQVFARDFLKGQTYALELAFAVDGTHAGQEVDPHFSEFVHALRDNFLTSNVSALVGYAVGQVSLYSFKGERLNAVNDVLKVLEELDATPELKLLKLSTVADKFKHLLTKHPKYFQETTYDVGKEDFRPCFKLLEKTLPFTNTLDHTVEVVRNLRNKYGTRAAEAASSPETVDWKAVGHALRVLNEAVELLSTNQLTLPRPEAAYLLSVRCGEVPFEQVKDELSSKLDQVKHLQETSTLQRFTPELEQRFNDFLTAQLNEFYFGP